MAVSVIYVCGCGLEEGVGPLFKMLRYDIFGECGVNEC